MGNRDLKDRGANLGNTGCKTENEGVQNRELPGCKSENIGGANLGNRGCKSGHPYYLQPVVFNQHCLKQEESSTTLSLNTVAGVPANGDVCVSFDFALFSSEE